MKTTLVNDLTNATAGTAIVAPLWMPTLVSTSHIFSIFLPILGAIWLVVQIYAKVKEIRRGGPKK